MTVVRVKGFKIFNDRHGRRRCYHRKPDIAIDLTKARRLGRVPCGVCPHLGTDRGNDDEAGNARYVD